MHVLDETDLMLDLLREAGDEPVTLDELQVVGVRDPAAALLALELAGHSVHRVYEGPVADAAPMCVRLGAPRFFTDQPEPEPQRAPAPPAHPAGAPAPPATASDPQRRFVLAALVLALVVLLVTRRD